MFDVANILNQSLQIRENIVTSHSRDQNKFMIKSYAIAMLFISYFFFHECCKIVQDHSNESEMFKY